jgi:hypothetical protein
MTNTFSTIEQIQSLINSRWGIIDWDKQFRWWRPPARVSILMYADGPVNFQGGSFLGLQYVSTLLKSRAYFYADFQIETAHRDGTDPSASITGAKKLTDLDILAKYDEILFFGFNTTPNLSLEEVTLLDQFMAAPKLGGILVTGDHADLGRGIAGQITRAGEMRQYPAPDSVFPFWNTTLEDGPDPGFTYDFNDQSDDRPQDVRYKRYPLSLGLSTSRLRRYRPHPVLCSPDGPITVFPDHQHEGEALAPEPTPGDLQWPTKNGNQESPEVIAWGRIKDPSALKHGQEIGLVSTYNGHNVDVGRIIADSTWHHWFDINLTGLELPPSPYAGFDETAAGQAALKQIDAYFLNCGIWLAPPDKQAQMRNAGWWSILWSNQVVELPINTPIWILGEVAINVLGQRAPRCTVSEWILDFPIFREKIPRWEWPQLSEQFQLIDLPFEQFVAGGILNQLRQEFGSPNPQLSFPEKAPEDEIFQRAMLIGIENGLATLTQQFQSEAELIIKITANNFRLESLKKV